METVRTANPRDTNFLRSKEEQKVKVKDLTQSDVDFLNRMDGDVESRRRNQFINEIKKHPGFKPSMLQPPKGEFQEVSLTSGPIVKTHEKNKTGLETKKPHQWGPLGGYY